MVCGQYRHVLQSGLHVIALAGIDLIQYINSIPKVDWQLVVGISLTYLHPSFLTRGNLGGASFVVSS